MGEVVATFLLLALVLCLVSAGVEDARTRNIANWKNAAIALAAPAWWWANGLALWPDVAIQIGIAALVFAFFVGAFAIGQMGGGDVKLIGALALWLPFQSLLSAIVLMTLLGGALTLLMVADQWVRSGQGMPRLTRPVPLGALVALVGGVVLLVWPGNAAALQAEPALLLLSFMVAICAIAVLLLAVIRSARRRGILPETPYGVAIAAAALIILREPIFNQFG